MTLMTNDEGLVRNQVTWKDTDDNIDDWRLPCDYPFDKLVTTPKYWWQHLRTFDELNSWLSSLKLKVACLAVIYHGILYKNWPVSMWANNESLHITFEPLSFPLPLPHHIVNETIALPYLPWFSKPTCNMQPSCCLVRSKMIFFQEKHHFSHLFFVTWWSSWWNAGRMRILSM